MVAVAFLSAAHSRFEMQILVARRAAIAFILASLLKNSPIFAIASRSVATPALKSPSPLPQRCKLPVVKTFGEVSQK